MYNLAKSNSLRGNKARTRTIDQRMTNRQIQSRLQVFISSTYLDLKEDRQAAVMAVLKSGHIPAGMELFTAGNESQLEIIQRWIEESDIYMLILAGRYGSIHEKSGKSYTELEYDYAVSLKKPIFACVIRPEALEARVRVHGTSVLEQDSQDKWKLFRDKVRSRVCSEFEDAKDIKLSVHETMGDYQRRFQLSGWVRGDFLKELNTFDLELRESQRQNQLLQKEIAGLSKQLTKAKSKLADEWPEEQLIDILDLLENDKLSVTKKEGGLENDSYSLFQLVQGFKTHLVLGVSNIMGMDVLDSFLFYRCFPRLEIHGLASLEKNSGVQWKTYRMTKKGTALLAFLEKQKANIAKSKP